MAVVTEVTRLITVELPEHGRIEGLQGMTKVTCLGNRSDPRMKCRYETLIATGLR